MITRIWERLYVGDAKATERLSQDNELRIETVITLCPEAIRSKYPRIKYIHAPIPDGIFEAEMLDRVLNEIGVQIQKGRLLLHCAASFSRSPCMAAMWMEAAGYQTFDVALRGIMRARPVTDPSPRLVNSVKELSPQKGCG